MTQETIKTNKKQRAIVVCPGRGTYNKEELGYLNKYHQDKLTFVKDIDAYRAVKNQVSIQSLDEADKYNMRSHTAGENASALIYACAYSDFLDIDREQYDIVAVTGNSMGWYIALAVAQVLDDKGAIELINTMGSMMADKLIGGQLVYPIVDENWHIDESQKAMVLSVVEEINQQVNYQLYVSIELGGYLVLAGNEQGIGLAQQKLPEIDARYPMKLFNHGAFHSPLLDDISAKAKATLASSLFNAPTIPLIDGEGNIWQPYATDVEKIWEYTLGKQVVDTYSFSKAIEVAVKEFAPDKIIVLGPGSSLGGAVAQQLIAQKWQSLIDKSSFIEQQKIEPLILAMGLEAQRAKVV